MIGRIVKIEDREGLFVVVDVKSYEDLGSMSYERDYQIVEYKPELDDLEIDLSKTMKYEVRGKSKLPIKVLENKMPYTQYGTSDIRGVKKVYFERKWEKVVIPER